MAKRDNSAKVIQKLQYDIDQEKKQKAKYRQEIDELRQQKMILSETMVALVDDDTYWSDDAKQSGIINRLKKVLQQTK
jgi:FtsZ-binding cell division protein ZapB